MKRISALLLILCLLALPALAEPEPAKLALDEPLAIDLDGDGTEETVSLSDLGGSSTDYRLVGAGETYSDAYTVSEDGTVVLNVQDQLDPDAAVKTVTIKGINNFKDSMVRTFSITEPSSSGTMNVITSPTANAEFAVDSQITVKAVAGIFHNTIL